jgi:hypothetical protein
MDLEFSVVSALEIGRLELVVGGVGLVSERTLTDCSVGTGVSVDCWEDEECGSGRAETGQEHGEQRYLHFIVERCSKDLYL